jgi:hypothetical protein
LSESVEGRRFVYSAKSGNRLAPYLYLGVTAICVLGGALGFAFCITRPPEQHVGPIGLQVVTTLPLLLGLGSFLYAVNLFRTPRRIELNRRAIVIETRRMTREIPWEDVEYVELDKALAFPPNSTTQKRLVLRDGNRRKLAVLSGDLENFDDLSERLQRISSKRTGNPTMVAAARRAKPMAVFFCAFGVLAAAGAVFMGWSVRSEGKSKQLIQSEGVVTDAKILKHEMYNGIAPRIEYSFCDASGREFRRDTMLMTDEWKRLEGFESVPVRYVRSDPDYSRVIEGESSEGQMEPMTLLLTSIGLALFSGLFFAVGALRWNGLDVTFDEQTRRFRLKRLGEAAKIVNADRPTE